MAKRILHANLPVVFLKEKDKFIAYSPALDLSTSGDSYEQAQKRFSEAADIFFEELTHKGTLDNVLCDLGWSKVRKNWQAPVLISQQTENVRLPAYA